MQNDPRLIPWETYEEDALLVPIARLARPVELVLDDQSVRASGQTIK